MFTPQFQNEGSYSPDMLIAGDHPVRSIGVTIVSGAGALVRGTVLGKITTGGKYKTSTSAASDGSQTPVAILGEDVNAASADAIAFVYIAGDFNTSALTIGAGHTASSIRDGLAHKSIYLHDPVPA
jgi:hypothetical protein